MMQKEPLLQEESLAPRTKPSVILELLARWDSTLMWRRRNRYTLRAVLIALVVAFLIITIGFGYTLMTLFFVAIALGIGAWRDRNPWIFKLIDYFS